MEAEKNPAEGKTRKPQEDVEHQVHPMITRDIQSVEMVVDPKERVVRALGRPCRISRPGRRGKDRSGSGCRDCPGLLDGRPKKKALFRD